MLIVSLLNCWLKRLFLGNSLLAMALAHAPTNVRCFKCNQLDHTRKLCRKPAQGNSNYTARKGLARVEAYTICETPEVLVAPVTSDSSSEW